MKNDRVRVGIIGAGNITKRNHIPGFRNLDQVELVGVVNRTIDSSNKVAEEFNIPKTYKNWSDLVIDSNIDAVCIGTWPYLHKTIVRQHLNMINMFWSRHAYLWMRNKHIKC